MRTGGTTEGKIPRHPPTTNSYEVKLFYASRFVLGLLPIILPLRIRLGVVPQPLKKRPVYAINRLMGIAKTQRAFTVHHLLK
jgi:hypothetical protein